VVRRLGGGGPGWRRPGEAAALGGGGLERVFWRGGGLGAAARRRRPGEVAELGLAEAKKISGSDYHVRGDGLQRNWMPLLIGEGLHL
jgi:hypothetical protein